MLERMSESSRLEALRFLLRVQERDLARTRRWIAQEEGRAAAAVRAVAAEEPSESLPEWVIDRGIVHRNCWVPDPKRTRAATREQALAALAGDGQPCDACQPDAAVGERTYLKGTKE